jgi:hypothetical protein
VAELSLTVLIDSAEFDVPAKLVAVNTPVEGLYVNGDVTSSTNKGKPEPAADLLKGI